MRLAACAVSIVILLTASCGYVGPVLPPSPEIPAAITDLSAVERGDKIIITFTTPPRTTDGVAITKLSEIDLRVATAEETPEAGKSYSVDLPSPSDREDPQSKPVTYSIPVSDFTSRRISVFVRTSVKKTGHFSSWSKAAVFDVLPPLQQPVVHAEGSANGIVLNWAAGNDAQYLIQRQGPSDKQPINLATVKENHYVDVSALFDTEYRYTVTAKQGAAESLPSQGITYLAKDIYPPVTPTGLTVVAGPDAVDLAWQRNAEPDFQGYYIYRSIDNGPYQKQGGLVNQPTYVDHNVEHGKTYSYKISAIDKKANESGQSSPAEVQY